MVDCKSEGHILGVKKWLWGDVHLCNKWYNSFGHILRKAGKHESKDIVGSNRNRSRDIYTAKCNAYLHFTAVLNGGGKGAQSRAEYSVQRHDRQKSGGISTLAREEVSSKMCLERDSQKNKVCNDCTLYFLPHKKHIRKHFEEERKICPPKGG